MDSEADHYSRQVAEHSARQFFEENPSTPEIAMQKGQSVICVLFDLPDDRGALFDWLSTELHAAGVRQVAHAIYPPADEESPRRAHALLLDPEGEDWNWIEFLVGMTVLRSEELAATGRTPDGRNAGRKRLRPKRQVPTHRCRMGARRLIRQTRSNRRSFL